jgi:hypothetical protein
MNDLLLAVGGVAGSVIATVVAIMSASKESHGVRRTLIILAVAGLIASGICAGLQYKSASDASLHQKNAESNARDTKTELHATKDELDKAKSILETASVNVDALAQLNKLSSSKFHVRLSVDSDVCLPCAREHAIDTQFPGAITNQEIRVIDVGQGGERYHLIFGNDLPLAAAGVYQRLAIDHNLSKGLPLIVSETANEAAVDCAKRCSARK